MSWEGSPKGGVAIWGVRGSQNNFAESERRENRQNRPQKALETAKMDLGRAEKGPLGPFSAFQGPKKAGIPLKGLPTGSRRVPEGLGRHPDGYGRHLKAYFDCFGLSGGYFGVILGVPAILAGHLGPLCHVRVLETDEI